MTEQSHRHKAEFYRRFNIAHTVKDGWKPKDMTISAKYEEGAEPTHERMVSEASKAIREAQAACDELNAQERQVAQLKGNHQ